MLTKEKVQEILEEVFSDYVRVEDADAQKVYDGLMEMLSEQAVEHTLAPDEGGECRCNAEHAHMTYIPHEEGCPARLRR